MINLERHFPVDDGECCPLQGGRPCNAERCAFFEEEHGCLLGLYLREIARALCALAHKKE